MPAFVTNIAAYRFARLDGLKALREQLISQCKAWGLRGTILLSTEGINLFVAGPGPEIDALVATLRAIDGLAGLTPKYSQSEDQPFSRMLVRIKKEIIAFGVEGIDPSRRSSPKLSPQVLKQWLDEGRPVTLLDTRNDYEVKLGTFKGALTMPMDHFRQFPAAVRELPPGLKQQPIVMFCTGGIRCEKAGPFMEREGFEQVYQLEGGILKYFEECGGDHYEGECFVFDQRVGVDPSLRETDATQCFACQTPLDAEEQRDPRFVEGRTCPYCFKTSAEQIADVLAGRQEAIRRATTPLPGSVPYENRRPLHVPGDSSGRTLLDFLCSIFPQTGREEWLRRCEAGRFEDEAGRQVPATQILREGERYAQVMPCAPEPEVNGNIRILHEDEAILVLHKPAPLPMHPSGRFNRNTLQHILSEVYAPQRPRLVHRLDANTTGLVVCARTRHFAALLQRQFTTGSIEKTYLARIQGDPAENAFTCKAPIGTVPGDLGSRAVDEAGGQPAHTEFTVLRRHADGTTLVEARPLTGRTNQIRVHLWHLGHPICGDPAYQAGRQLGDTQTLATDAAPLCLHAWRLVLDHPLTKERMTFESERPEWARSDS